ncbi:hypothetical protein HMPREF9455_03814 [Dysgonomonas gadei ATCC BAA-286]|uniref:Secretin/TonB short N-terminal domain-containing protein n=2 Tax=Dysgonomonas gadei TaxID=156974 RepID=F5J397_9BACT|nr:hypothetical protein HMPREF9455_03814 [Dysgonomonas gadei ATCC BAA-286]
MENKVFHDRFLLKNEKIKHFFRIMKITTLLLFVGILSIYAEDSYSQKARVTINEKNIRLDKVLTEIEKQTDYLFIYNDKVETDQKVSVKANTKPVYQVLNDLFKETNVNYSMEGSHIILSNRNEPEVSFVNTPLQEGKTITGKVQDEQGEPLVGVSVAVKGTTTGTVTDINGGYTLKVTNPNATLFFSFIGFLSQEVELKGQSTVNITLAEDVKVLDEIVVVGYGVQRKIDVTGSISVTKSDEILKQQSFGALDGLKGKASGVNIFSNSGQPGGASRVMIRGIGTINASSNPLYVVDGVAMDDFKFLNPNDIERVEVLKDASSAAIYGARGANGVILVTTKRGLTGTGVKISYNGSVSMSTMANYIDVMNSEEWMEAFMIGQANANKYQGKNYSLNVKDYFKDPNLFTSDGKPIYDTDWQKEATRTAFSHNHQLSIQQGGKDSSVGAFLNYTDQQGIMLNSYMKRLNAKMAYDAKPTAWLSTAINLLVNHTWGNEAEETGGHQMPRRSMLEMVPFMPVKFPDGGWSNSTSISDELGLEGMANPVHVLKTQERMRYRTQIFGNAALTFHLAPGLDLKTQFGIDSHFDKERDYSPTDLSNISYPNGDARIKDINMFFWQEETYLTYLKTLDKHRINLMAGLSWQERVFRTNQSQTKGFTDDFYGTNNMGVGTLPEKPGSEYQKWSMNSYFLRAAYTYNDKYMTTLTGRIDGSSRFGENNKYAFFPSAGLGWLMSNEDFMKDINAISNLKLHTSYGITGNSEIPVYQSLAMMGSGTTLINGSLVPTAWPDRLANPDLKWEKTYTFDVGVELGLFRNRLNFDVSYYNKKTKDLLLARPVPYHTGYSSVMSNMGEVTNQGVDILISSTNVETSDFTWGTTLNMNYNKNKINALGENNEDIFPDPSWVSGPQTILRVGESLSSFWGYERLGIWTEEDKAAGRIPSGQIVGQAKRSAEKKVLGKGIPDITGSFINNFRYKNFDMTIDMQFVLGVDVLQQFTHSLEDRFGLTNGEKAILHDAWSPSNPNTIVQAIRNGARDGQSSELDSRWVADGSYLRANLIQLGYTFNPKMIKPLSLSSLRVYFGVNNAFLIKSSDFRGYDPEATSQGDNQWGQNMFFFQYPKPRTFTFGVSATF